MTSFTPVKRDIRENQLYRDALLAQPPNFFRTHYGFVPDVMEKLCLVEMALQSMGAARTFMNDIYMVRVREMPPFIQLNIARHDRQPCKNWRDFQWIKNQLVGAECEGVELFPAESRLVDTSNEYHLWVHPDRTHRFPFGFPQRLMIEGPLVYRKGDEYVQLTDDNTVAMRSANAVS